MNESQFWKNFRLGEELHVAGAFIYNALRKFHELDILDHQDEVFEFLYDLSVGLERLIKIAVVMHEHGDDTDQAALEKSLITHSHLELVSRLRRATPISLSAPQNELLQLLSRFYKTLRYDRFSLTSVYDGKKESSTLRKFISKHLKVDFPEYGGIFATPNDDRYKRFIRRTAIGLSKILYEIVETRARSLGLYTYELRYGSKAYSVFLRNVDIQDEDTLWKELLVFFMNSRATSGYMKYLKEISPLSFDPALTSDYLECFKSNASKSNVMDELESMYELMEPGERKRRFEVIGLIAAHGVYFDEDDCAYDDDDHTGGEDTEDKSNY